VGLLATVLFVLLPVLLWHTLRSPGIGDKTVKGDASVSLLSATLMQPPKANERGDLLLVIKLRITNIGQGRIWTYSGWGKRLHDEFGNEFREVAPFEFGLGAKPPFKSVRSMRLDPGQSIEDEIGFLVPVHSKRFTCRLRNQEPDALMPKSGKGEGEFEFTFDRPATPAADEPVSSPIQTTEPVSDRKKTNRNKSRGPAHVDDKAQESAHGGMGKGTVLPDAIGISPDFTLYVEAKPFAEKGSKEYAGGLKVKEVKSGKQVNALAWDREAWGYPYDAQFSPDGKWLSVMAGRGSGGDTTAKVFNLQTKEMHFNVRQPERLISVLFSPDSKYLATQGEGSSQGLGRVSWRDKPVIVWEVATRKQVMQLPRREGRQPGLLGRYPKSMAFSADKLIVAYDKFSVFEQYGRSSKSFVGFAAWEIEAEKPAWELQVEVEHGNNREEELAAVAFSSDSKLIAFADKQGSVKVWDFTTRTEVARFDDIQDEVFCLAFRPKRALLAATGKDKTLRFWNVEQKRLVSTTKLEYPLRFRFSTDGEGLAMFGNGIELWRLKLNE
jgi:hypothetical protein